MSILSNLKNSLRKVKRGKRVGRGIGSGHGKTSCRGHKGYGSRRGSTLRLGYEGGQVRLFAKLPRKGFKRGKFLKPCFELNLLEINLFFKDGETVNIQALKEKGLVPNKANMKLKILANGQLKTKPQAVEASSFSKAAIKQLEDKKITYKVLSK